MWGPTRKLKDRGEYEEQKSLLETQMENYRSLIVSTETNLKALKLSPPVRNDTQDSKSWSEIKGLWNTKVSVTEKKLTHLLSDKEQLDIRSQQLLKESLKLDFADKLKIALLNLKEEQVEIPQQHKMELVQNAKEEIQNEHGVHLTFEPKSVGVLGTAAAVDKARVAITDVMDITTVSVDYEHQKRELASTYTPIISKKYDVKVELQTSTPQRRPPLSYTQPYNKFSNTTQWVSITGKEERVEQAKAEFVSLFSGQYSMKIDIELIPLVIGKKGINIRKLSTDSGTFMKIADVRNPHTHIDGRHTHTHTHTHTHYLSFFLGRN
eukprot:GHVR01114668.1.p1 GENE.GHVR01114668.1~~GHVR01114668.1.p1  ORF type:complete len:323 (+),score=87.54 GHVR01114668.1:100-1068(+)